MDALNSSKRQKKNKGKGKGKGKARESTQTRIQWNLAQTEQGESSRAGTAAQPIDVDAFEEEELDSEDDPLGAELQRQRRPQQPGIKIKGWIEYCPPGHEIPPPPLASEAPSPLYPPLPRLRTPPLFEPNLTFSPLPSISWTMSSTPSILRASPTPSHDPTPSPQPTVSLMTSPAKKRPRRDALRPWRYRDQ